MGNSCFQSKGACALTIQEINENYDNESIQRLSRSSIKKVLAKVPRLSDVSNSTIYQKRQIQNKKGVYVLSMQANMETRDEIA